MSSRVPDEPLMMTVGVHDDSTVLLPVLEEKLLCGLLARIAFGDEWGL